MTRLRAIRTVAAVLVFCLLVVGGLASAQSIAHESHHAHHQKATHGTVLCSWMCAAGQVLDGASAPDLAQYALETFADDFLFLFTPHTALDSVTSRGPPSRSRTSLT